MGQYHIPVNLDKREFIWPHGLGDGLKLGEQIGAYAGVASALHVLLAASVRGGARGGGDYEHPVAGRWAGDRIAIIGDYATDHDLPHNQVDKDDPPPSRIYALCVPDGYGSSVLPEDRFTDITALVRDALRAILGVEYVAPAYADNPATAWLDVVKG